MANWRSVLSVVQTWTQQNDASGTATEIVLVYSGHGFFQKTSDPSERDGCSECIVLLDGMYWDDQFSREWIQPLPASATVFALFDSCHSGTVMNLPWSVTYPSTAAIAENGLIVKPTIVMISGCQDRQTSSAGNGSSPYSVLSGAIAPLLPARRLDMTTAGIRSTYQQLCSSLASHQEAQRPVLSVSALGLDDALW